MSKKLSPKVAELRSLRPTRSYIGRYRFLTDPINGKSRNQIVRDSWKVGEVFESRDGRQYMVAPSGALLRGGWR